MIKRFMKLLISSFLIVITTSLINACQSTPKETVNHSKALSANQVKTLFTNKTFDGYNELNGVEYQVFSAEDGSMLHKSNKRLVSVSWEVKPDGQHCTIFPETTFCGHIIPVGDGVYHKVTEGKHTRTLKHFMEGNQILFP